MNDDKAEPPESVEAILAKAARLSRQGPVRPPNVPADTPLPRSMAQRQFTDRPEDLSASLAAIVQKAAHRSRLEADGKGLAVDKSSGSAAERQTQSTAEQKPPSAAAGPVDPESPAVDSAPIADAAPTEASEGEKRAAAEAEAAAEREWAAIEKAARERVAGQKGSLAQVDVAPANMARASTATAVTATPSNDEWAAPVWEQQQRPGVKLLRRGILVGLACCAALASGWVARNWWDGTHGDAAPVSPLASAQSRDLARTAAPPMVDPAPTAQAPTTLPPVTANATSQSESPESATLNAAPPGAGATRASPTGISLGVVAEREVGPGPWLVDELARRIGPRSDTRIAGVASDGWAASLAALTQQPRVTVVRYDALQAARRERAAAGGLPALEIVAPLSTEAVYFVVRADSPLRFIHQIRDRAINVGPLKSSSALTAQTAYRQMFQRAPAAARLGRLDDVAALERLRTDKALEVVVASGAGARAWLQQLSAADAAQFRLLELDRENAAGRRLAGAFLPVTVAAASLGGFPASAAVTPSAMSFIVTARGSAAEREPQDRAVAALASSLCSAPLNGPQRSGGAWQSVDPALAPDVGWPYSPVARAVFARCERSGITPARGATAASTPTTS